ncbi:ArsR/SmtB family transcription factor [Streptomyces chiangmaiensis]|uniref:Metalloregulator ArsR/SmtB family transcription factor n=1 Tax=Streptomyces chiangmaiensis TaxID=766497 RepID=A0ABU7FKC4_9ACTN|nr:metalloregulator ArsR/SmtB family transcription factor [Streptomyces chiangmaiensis]MED7824567.1 metalloregulator ArsR/SmtB family transcription factor [Streptomyces chiangmaiensis]
MARLEEAPSASADTRIQALRRTLPPQSTAHELAQTFSLMSDPRRLQLLLALLIGGEIPVSDLAAATGQSMSSTSHSLRLLRMQHIVDVRRSGRQAYYRLADTHVRLLLDVALTPSRHAPPGRSLDGSN